MTKQMVTKKYCGLYIHIPFCVSKCSYCDFASVVKNNTLIDEYTTALCKEMTLYKAKFCDTTIDTIFIGGGTPSCIPQKNLKTIVSSIYKNFNTNTKEFTVEINPGTGNPGLFIMLRDMGVNRASIGLQCANDTILKSIGRIHNINQFKDTINQIKMVGIDNFSVDIISGLPNQTDEDLINSINLVNELDAKHISMYALKLENGTPLEHSVTNGTITLPQEDDEYNMSLKARQYLHSLGYNRYEISNFAKRGYESKHNLKYWQLQPYLGLGVAAASMYDNTRYINVNSIKNYIALVNSNKLPLSETTVLSKNDIAFEMIMLYTRLSKGLEYDKYNQFTGESFIEKYSDIIKELEELELINKSSTHLVLTQKGMDLQNNILLKFMD